MTFSKTYPRTMKVNGKTSKMTVSSHGPDLRTMVNNVSLSFWPKGSGEGIGLDDVSHTEYGYMIDDMLKTLRSNNELQTR